MSSRIMICPACGAIAALVELPRETAADLTASLTNGHGRNYDWETQAHWCPSCDTPVVTSWPKGLEKGLRRQLVGLPADLLQVEEDT